MSAGASSSPGAAAAQPDWLGDLRERVRDVRAEDLSGFVPPKDPPPREGAVLVLFGQGGESGDELFLLLTERAHTMRAQPGQVSFPGGSLDPGETAVECALREAQEETGIDPAGIEVVAELPRLWLPPRNFAVAPVLAWWREPQAGQQQIDPNPHEVHAVFQVPVADLLDPDQRFTVRHPMGWQGPAWWIGPERDVMLWGFTAGVVSRLLDVLDWTEPWNEADVRPLPEDQVEWRRIAESLGIEVPEDEEFDPVAAGLVASREDPPDAGAGDAR